MKPGLTRAYLYCPSLSRGGGEARPYCCGDLNARTCCSASEWQADQLARARQESDPENREESQQLRDMPGRAIALILLGSVAFTVLVTFLICCRFWKLLCCSCCGCIVSIYFTVSKTF